MGQYYFPLLVILLILAVFTKIDFAFILIYLFAGVYAASKWWISKAMDKLLFSRNFLPRVFPGNELEVNLSLKNTSWLPIIWLQIAENIPSELVGNNFFRKVVSINPKGSVEAIYKLYPKKRGYYKIGPIELTSGDLFGLSNETVRIGEQNYLTVFPRVIPLVNIKLPTRAPQGTLRYKQPIFEDPSRVIGKRNYVTGDSFKKIDWKSTAVTGRIQVKKLESSIDLETVLYLNYCRDDYHYRRRIEATELAVVVAASIGNWLINKKQSVGISTIATDPLKVDGDFTKIPPGKGQSSYMRVLDLLARIDLTNNNNFLYYLRRDIFRLSWGTTLVVITGTASIEIFELLVQALRMGLTIVLIVCGAVLNLEDIRNRSAKFGIPFFHFLREGDLDVWRK